MTPITEPALSAAPAVPAYRQAQRVTLPRVIRSEWTKLRSLPSTLWLLLATVVLVAGGGLLAALLQLSSLPRGHAAIAAFDPAGLSLTGVGLAELTAGALGVLLVTGEYGTGQIKLTFTAVPRRLPVLWGKAVAMVLAVLTVSLAATLTAFFVTQAILAPHHLSTTLGHPGVTRAVVGSALFLTADALLGLAMGAALRNTAGAICTLFGVLYGLTIAAGFVPGHLSEQIRNYLPENVGARLGAVHGPAGALAPWTGFGLFCLYTAGLLGLAAWLLRRRDA
jgi:ABC-type transport system involved in multi-copper enzyme maturation permease subunit